MSNYQKPVIAIEWLTRYMKNKGYSKSQILEAAGFDIKASKSNLKIMPYPNMLILLDWLSVAEENPDLGFDLSHCALPEDLGPVTLLAYQTPTLKDFIETLIKYQSLVTTAIDMQLNIGAIETEFNYNLLVPNRPGSRVDIDYTLTMFTDLITGEDHDNWKPIRVDLSYPEPLDKSRIHKEYGSKVKFDQPTNSLFFETKLLNKVINNTAPELLELMRSEIDNLFSGYNENKDLFSKVRACIASSLSSGNCNSMSVARQMNISQRTMVRHLASLNTSLREIKADVIEELSKTALCKTHSSIYEIAIQMGFSETSSFDRMFKKKTGYTPIQFREQYLDMDYTNSKSRYF